MAKAIPKTKSRPVFEADEKPEYLTAALTAERLQMSPRRLREIAAEGKLKRHSSVDPVTRRPVTLYLASEVERFENEWKAPTVTAKSLAPLAANRLLLPPPAAAAVPPPLKPWLSLADAADYSGLHEKTILHLIRNGRLPAINQHIPDDRWRIRRVDLDALEGESQV